MSLTIWKGNRLPLLTDTITSGGAAFDLTGSTVLFSMRPTNSATLKVSGSTATIVTAASGTVSYSWGANDTDTVGNYYGWWTYSKNGLTQDTSEFAISITEHTPASLAAPTPVASDGTTTIYAGDAYLNSYGTALVYQVAPQDAPDLTGSTLTYRIEGENHYTMTVVDEDCAYLELTSTQTAALAAGTYAYEIRASLSAGNSITLTRGRITVTAAMSSP